VRRSGTIATLAAVIALLGPAAARATPPGQLDSSFGGGTVLQPPGVQLLGVAVRGDGSVVAAGTDGHHAQLAQYTSGGALASLSAGAGPVARAVAIQGDGKIVVAGGDSTDNAGMVIERFNSNGTPDQSFGSGGAVTLYAGLNAQANAVALQSTGEIVVAGTATNSTSYPGVALVRLNPANGHVDSAGLFNLGPLSTANSAAVQGDDKIVIGGSQRDSGLQVTNVMAARFNAAGTALDPSFGSGGAFASQFATNGAAFSSFYGVALQPDGKVVLAGMAYDGNTGANMLVARYTSAGAPDAGFGSSGVVRVPATANGNSFSQRPPLPGAHAVTVSGGKIVAAGYAYDIFGTKRLELWALTPSGALDSTFGSGGTAGGQAGEANGIAPAPGGNLVIAGDTGDGSPPTSALVARYGAPIPVPAQPPSATTGAASQVAADSAVVAGQVNPNGLTTSYHFDYGQTTAYGSSTPTASAGAGSTPVAVSATLRPLSPATTYHYRLVASNADGTSYGADGTFTTAPSRVPAAGTGRASRITEISAALAGKVTPNGLLTFYHFDYGKTRAYGSSTPTATVDPGPSLTVSASLKRLLPGTTYHYRLVASNAVGTSYGPDRTFKTKPRLSIVVSGFARSYKISLVIKSGLGLKVRGNQGCSIAGTLTIPAASAARRRHAQRQIVLGGGSASLKRAGTVALQLRLTSAGKQTIAGLRNLTVTLRIVATPAGGGPAVSSSRTLTFMR
jgi:uncharacterized delta-60 repeat protein